MNKGITTSGNIKADHISELQKDRPEIQGLGEFGAG